MRFATPEETFSLEIGKVKATPGHETVIQNGQSQIRCIEHLLAVLHGLQLDNLTVHIAGGEPPHLPGGLETNLALEIAKGGRVEQSEALRPLIATTSWEFRDGDSWARIAPSPTNTLSVHAHIEFDQPIGRQSLTYLHRGPADFIREIAWARTFSWQSIDALWPTGVNHWDETRSRCKLLPPDPRQSPILSFTHGGWLVNPTEADEPVRHKILDFLGDIFIGGRPVIADIEVHLPGHLFNNRLARVFYEHVTAAEVPMGRSLAPEKA